MPLSGERLIVEPSYPYAAALSEIGQGSDEKENEGWRIRNSWYSLHHRCEILIMEDPDGKVVPGKLPAFHHIKHDLRTLGCADAWGLEQEHNALQLLGTLVSHRQMRQYVLTGSFLESSKRSGVTYIFRRLKPTVAVGTGADEAGMRILACLCLHPIAYYAGSWAGAMVPTDDVVAHLMLMRGDEHMFWKRSSQHPPTRPEAGL